MFGAFSFGVLGFVLGVRHAVDADHVAAVSTIVAGQPSVRQSALTGAVWGLGHSATLLAVGGPMVWFRLTVSARVGVALEFVVALMLIALGILNMARARRAAPLNALPPAVSQTRPLVVGMVHGLAGSAAAAFLVLAAVPTGRGAVVYLLLFAAGTMIGMMGVTAALAYPLARWSVRSRAAQPWLLAASGVVSLAIGVAMVFNLSVAWNS